MCQQLPSVRKVMGSITVGYSDFFSVPRLCHIDQFTFPILLLSLEFAIFIHLPLLTMTLTVLVLAVSWTPVTYEFS